MVDAFFSTVDWNGCYSPNVGRDRAVGVCSSNKKPATSCTSSSSSRSGSSSNLAAAGVATLLVVVVVWYWYWYWY